MHEFQTVFEYYLNPERAFLFGTEVQRAMRKFIGSRHALPPLALQYFADWFVFDFPLAGGETPIRRFPKANPANLPPAALEPFIELAEHNRFDFFRVSRLAKDDMTLESVREDSRYEVVRGGMRAVENDVVVCRVGRSKRAWEVLTLDPIGITPSLRDLARMKTGFPLFDSRVAYRDIIASSDVGS